MDIQEINDVIRSQEKDSAELKRIWDNIKKDSNTRKTQKYIEDRRALLDSIYQRALQNHRLLENQEIMSTHKYLTCHYFDQTIQKPYDAAKGHLAAQEGILSKDTEIQTPAASGLYDIKDKTHHEDSSVMHQQDTTMTPKLFIQKYRLNQLKKKLSTAQTAISENKPAWHLQTLIRTLEKQFQEIDDNHVYLLMEQSIFDDKYFTDNYFEEAQDEYDAIVDKLQEKINNDSRQNSKTQSTTKLPRITIPYFTGSYESWNSFYDLFKKIIHDDTTISSTEKMQYLKTHVRGEAEKLIKHLTVNEVNYNAALTLLTNRYKDERLISQTFIDKLLDLPKLQISNAKMLRNMHDCINESLEALKNQNIDISTWDPILCRIISRKWDADTNMKYEDQLEEPNKLQNFTKMMKFLEKRFKSLESSKPAYLSVKSTISVPPRSQEKPTAWTDKKGLCWYCNEEHNIQHCTAFKTLNVNDRIKLVREKQMCNICLMHDSQKQCFSDYYKKCGVCHKAHATLLHQPLNNYLSTKPQGYNYVNKNNATLARPGPSKPLFKPQQKEEKVQKSSTNTSTRHNDTQKTVLLATALVHTTTFDGTPQLLRVLCDQGSEVSLCTEESAQLLGIPRQKIKAEIKGIADEKPKTSSYKIDVTLKPRFPSKYTLKTSLIVLPKLTGSLPKQEVHQLENQYLDNKIVADPTYYKRGPIDIILGAEDYSKLLLPGFEKIGNGIIAQNTELGWILSGLGLTESSKGLKITSLVTRVDDTDISKFWELEEFPDDYQMNTDDQQCEKIYNDTTRRNPDGTYTVKLLFKDPGLEYGNTRQKAVARLLQLEKKFEKSSNLRQQYNVFMKEYLEMGHMMKVNKTNYYVGKYYIPHQPVIREDALTSKLRCVFDASSKSSTKISLNDNLHKGPRLQQDLATILLRWRKHKFVFMADVEKMYRFIKMHPEDYTFQRILWRWTPQENIQEYALTTVTYGTTCAPYLAIKTLQQLAKDEQKNYPTASKVTMEDFYVDDVLSGGNDLEQTRILQTQLINMMRAGGFNLRKWSSNSTKLLENVPEHDSNDKLVKLPLEETRKSLGVMWSPDADNFQFKITTTENDHPTKRFILSEIAKLFDPHGWLQPVTITMKLLVQEIWTLGIDWNDKVPEHIKIKWNNIHQQLKTIENIKIPRWIHYHETQIELHGFSDASEKAYGAVVYCRTKVNGTYKITLLQAKTKVAPNKHKTTLPRLELCSALILTKLMYKINKAIDCNDTKMFCYTDSMITLGWIRGEADRWKTFVANRVSEIQKTLPNVTWNHVISADNPADVVSRGIEPSKLQNHELWWNGPKWLQTSERVNTKIIPETIEEVKHCHQTTIKIEQPESFERFSSFKKMVRVISYCLRFLRLQKNTGNLTCEEIDKTRKQIIRQVQKDAFQQEYNLLKRGQHLPKGNRLSSLDPFIDEFGLIRIGGRLQNSQLPYEQKHPTILPYDHHVTTTIIHDAHMTTLHGGNQLTLAYLRQRYWILGGKRKVKHYINKCVRCIRYKAETAKQKMGILPKPRVTQSFPFTHTGCDYAGPIQVRAMKGRGHKSYKGYIAVFVCLATKAIHLELVGDLSTETFIAALRRFMARRGPVSHIYSDNGTNFVGAANYLHKEILEITQSPQFQNAVTDIGTQWHFIPPAAPHFGGIWESGVRSMKHHLRRVIGDSTLTYEELSSFLTQIEACLNSRPLCIQTENINDNVILTPSHFLIGREAVGVPDPISDTNTDLINRWRHVQKMKKDFWNSWTKEYLHQLQQRYKWKSSNENLKIGTVVLIKDANLSPSKWPLAKIKYIHPGTDGATRVVTLERPQGADQKRAIHTLIPLPVNENLETETDQPTIKSSNTATVKRCYTKPKGAFYHWLIMCMTALILCTSTGATYTNRNLSPGLYIEQMGNATLDRGTFRVELHYERRLLEENFNKTKEVSNQFKALCSYATTVESQTYCTQYYDHLKEEVHKFERTHEYLTEINHTRRRRRGLMGQIMTSIFGVNDGVYRDINTLQQNQQKLIDSANHQTKFMISAITTVNDTEERIRNKLERFQTKLNQAMTYINDNNKWFKSINSNTIQIQVLQSYQLAHNYVKEIMDYYLGIAQIYVSKATIYSVLNPKTIADIILDANSKLPSNLNIIQTQLIDTKLFENETHIRVLAYYPIAEKAKYTLVHVTPIPKKNSKELFESIDISQTFMGIDYNNERYFQLTHEEFNNCLHRSNDYICFPVAVKNMQLNQNCIVRLLTKNLNTTDCPTRTYNITTNIIWKQVQMSNTWLYLTKHPETVSIVCDGQREEISIHDVGIIQISENCIIKTITTTLAAKRIVTTNVLASFSKISEFKLSNRTLIHYHKDISKEQVLDNSVDIFNHLKNRENALKTTLDHTVWSSITTQTYVISFSTILGSFIILLLIYYFGPQVARRVRAIATARRTWTPTSTDAPEQTQSNDNTDTHPSDNSGRHTPRRPTTPHIYALPERRQTQPETELYELRMLPDPVPERRQNVHVP